MEFQYFNIYIRPLMKTGTTEITSTTKAIAHNTAAGAHEQPPNVKQLQAYQQMADDSRRVQAQAQLQAAANRNAAGKGVVQRTAVHILFGTVSELVPGTDTEDDRTFYEALNASKYTLEKVYEIIQMLEGQGADASEWDKRMAAELKQMLEGDDEGEDEMEEEQPQSPPVAEYSGSDTDSSKKRKLKGKDKPEKKKKKVISSDEEEEQPAAVIEWDEKTVTGTLEYDGNKWWVKGGSNLYGIMNLNVITALLFEKAKATYKRPKQHYGPASKSYKEAFDQFGVVITAVGGATANETIPAIRVQQIAALQATVKKAQKQHEEERASGSKTYKPQRVDLNYAVDWQLSPPLSLQGSADSRTMVKSMDIGYQPAGAPAPLTLPGEELHDKKLFETEPLHGNSITACFSLAYLAGDQLLLSQGKKKTYGSGKTTSDVNEKREKADQIATMLTDSGQISSVGEYNDAKHAHSEQYMIVQMSQDLSVFDAVLPQVLKAAENNTVTIVGLVLDMFSNPNTVCEHCHPSLATFFTTTNWKGKITNRLLGKVGNKVAINNPEVIIRVSSSKSFSASATQAIKKPQDNHTVQQGAYDINFIERAPFNKPQY